MNHYEFLFVLKPTLTDEETQVNAEKIKAIIPEQEGTIIATDDMGMRKLAYPVEKQERGYYTVVYFTAPGTAIAELERQIRINEDILKFMTVKYTNKKEIAHFTKMADAATKKTVSANLKAEAASEPKAEATSEPKAEVAPEPKAEAAPSENSSDESAEA